MILLIKKGCPFCDISLQEDVMRAGGRVLCVAQGPDGKAYSEVEPRLFQEIPFELHALPTLITSDKKIYVGKNPIKDYIKTLASQEDVI